MTRTIPIAAFAPRLIEWLRRSSVQVVDGLAVSIPMPTIGEGDEGLVIMFGDGGVVVTIDRTDKTALLCDLLTHGRIDVAPGVDLVVPDVLGFDAEPLGSDAVRLTWPLGKKPRVDSLLPRWLDPYVECIELRPDAGVVKVTRGPDVELVWA